MLGPSLPYIAVVIVLTFRFNCPNTAAKSGLLSGNGAARASITAQPYQSIPCIALLRVARSR